MLALTAETIDLDLDHITDHCLITLNVKHAAPVLTKPTFRQRLKRWRPLDAEQEQQAQHTLAEWLRTTSPDDASWLQAFTVKALETARLTQHTTAAASRRGPTLPP